MHFSNTGLNLQKKKKAFFWAGGTRRREQRGKIAALVVVPVSQPGSGSGDSAACMQ
jgi:hypothetical protein